MIEGKSDPRKAGRRLEVYKVEGKSTYSTWDDSSLDIYTLPGPVHLEHTGWMGLWSGLQPAPLTFDLQAGHRYRVTGIRHAVREGKIYTPDEAIHELLQRTGIAPSEGWALAVYFNEGLSPNQHIESKDRKAQAILFEYAIHWTPLLKDLKTGALLHGREDPTATLVLSRMREQAEKRASP